MSYSSQVLSDSPLAYWRLEEASGTTAADSSGNGRSGTYAGTPGYSASPLDGSTGTSVDFSGDDWVNVASASWMDVTALTVECLFQADVAGGDRPLVTRTDWSVSNWNTNRAWYLMVWQGQIRCQVVTGTTSNVEIWGGTVTAGQIHHAAMTYDGADTLRLYLDGVEVANSSGALTGAPSANNRDIEIGTDTWNRYAKFDGRIDEVAVYGSALSVTRLAAHFAARTGDPPQAGSSALTGSGTLSATGAVAQLNGSSALSGSGTLSATGEGGTVLGSAALSGSGLLSATGTGGITIDTVALSSEGTLSVDGDFRIVFAIAMAIPDDVIEQTPSSLIVVLMEGWPDQWVEFQVDGLAIYEDQMDSEGQLGPVSIPIPETVLAGLHTLTVLPVDFPADTIGTSAPFTVEHDPDPLAVTPGPDSDPVDVPAAVSTTVRRWVLQDPAPGGLGSWVLPHNPDSAEPFPVSRALSKNRTLAASGGQFHVTDVREEVYPWSFSGTYFDRETQDRLLAYRDLNHRFYLIDHRERAWTVAFLGVDLVPRLRIRTTEGADNDEAGAYTVRGLILDREWKEPQ